MKSNLYALIYAALLGLACAMLPTAVGIYTTPFRQANEKAEEIRNILEVLEIPYSKKLTSQQLVTLYEKNVSVRDMHNLKMYVSGTGDIKISAVRFAGAGIWGPIKGFLALRPDMKTINGISFYQQEETPGLGGEIGTPAFRNQFKGKLVVDESGKPGFHIRRNNAKGRNEVDGISGATLTCGKVELILNSVIGQITKECSNE